MFKEIQSDNNVFKTLIDGRWQESSTGNVIEIKSPVSEEVIGSVQAMSKEEVDLAVKAAKKAGKKWRDTPLHEKSRMMYKAAELLEQNVDIGSELLMKEVGKDKKSAVSEIMRTADLIRFTADSAKSINGESVPSDSFPGFNSSKVSIVKREPLGVVLAISPFNYPINLASSKIVPALMGGNTLVFKPATQGSICGLFLADIFQMAGIPDGVLNTVTGRGSEIGDYCVSNEGIDFVNFTGSTEIGKRISSITTMKPLLLELGGKDAAIVLEDADIDLAAKNIVAGAYSYSGQRCTAIKRVIAINSIADELVSKIKELIEELKVGNPLKEQVDIVPLIDNKSADFVEGLMKDAEEKGAVLVTGGKREKNLIYPTLYDNVTTDMRLAWEEPFGPVLPVIRVKDKDEALEISNKSEYGLQSSVFTKNIDNAFYIAENLEVGTVQVNNKTERGPDHFPFLGVKSSGMGVQGIRYSIESMTRPKAIVLNIKK